MPARPCALRLASGFSAYTGGVPIPFPAALGGGILVVRPGTVPARRAPSARSFPRDGRSRGALPCAMGVGASGAVPFPRFPSCLVQHAPCARCNRGAGTGASRGMRSQGATPDPASEHWKVGSLGCSSERPRWRNGGGSSTRRGACWRLCESAVIRRTLHPERTRGGRAARSATAGSRSGMARRGNRDIRSILGGADRRSELCAREPAHDDRGPASKRSPRRCRPST